MRISDSQRLGSPGEGWKVSLTTLMNERYTIGGRVVVGVEGIFELARKIELDDGPLTVYDLERLGRAPYRMILSSCDSGVAAPAGADELLGLTSALIPLGTAGLVASVLPVNDEAAVPLMTMPRGVTS